jgi:oxygen-independent coproporphyrinogen-3 oxidase
VPELPSGIPAPDSGVLPSWAVADLARRDLGVYVHVPFCRVRCGYCDFNTYTPTELGGQLAEDAYLAAIAAEAELARRVLGPDRPAAATVFVGGGTPTLLGVQRLTALLDLMRSHFGLAAGAEVTVESNPDSVAEGDFAALAQAGVTRISFGVQSTVPHVLQALDRTHDPQRVAPLVTAARSAGLQVSVDLIYGAPGEADADWRQSLDAVVSLNPDHVSAYALVVEPGTRLAAQVRRGVVATPNDDVLADRYEMADEVLAAAGYSWYEISNWALNPAAQCRHNLGYWTGQNWWGLGPGAHSHVGGLRWWNVKHPAEYGGRLAAGRSPAAAREELDPKQQRMEAAMLRTRLAQPWGVATPQLLAQLQAESLVEVADEAGSVRLTRRGRLLADSVARALIESEG